jgi:hypothetical protein
MVEKVKQTELYNEVSELAQNNGFNLNLFIVPEGHPYSRLGAGFHEADEDNRTINIGIASDQENNDAVYIHELLHAKQFLTGYPKIYVYPKYEMQPSVEMALLEIENSVQHTLVYSEMKNLGYVQTEIDLRYLEGVKQDVNKKFEGGSKINRALRILEAHLRLPNLVMEMEKEIEVKQPTEYMLYRKMRHKLRNTKTPYDMRKAIVEIVQLVDSFVKKEEGQDLFLRILTRMDPFFNEYQLKQTASKILYTQKFNNNEDVFILSKSDNYCCFFMAGEVLFQHQVDEMLSRMTVVDFLEATHLNYKLLGGN